jgi:hypothetical protein
VTPTRRRRRSRRADVTRARIAGAASGAMVAVAAAQIHTALKGLEDKAAAGGRRRASS